MTERRRSARGLRVLITGAASGIGRAVALRLAADGAELFLTDLRAAPLAAVADEARAAGATVLLAHACDLADHSAVVELAARVHEHIDAVDALLNVAGIAVWGTVSALSHDDWRRVVDVNLMGPIHVIESFVPPMVTAGRGGYLVNVSSAAGLIGLPWHAPYSASRFGLRGVSEVLRFDLARHKIAVRLVCPGGVDTPLADTVRIAGIDTSTPEAAKAVARFRHRAVSAEVAGERIVAGMFGRRYLVYTSNDIRLIHAVQRFVPPLYSAAMTLANRAADAAGRKLAAASAPIEPITSGDRR